jgi:hypothetical protein
MNKAALKTSFLDHGKLSARLVYCGFFILMFIAGCHWVSKTPSRDLYNYKFMSKEWKTVVREIVAAPERQTSIIESSRITGDGFTQLKIESQITRRDYLKTLACYDCDLNDFEPLMERIQAAEEGSTQMILDFLDVVRENTTKEELRQLIKRKLKP